MFELREKSRHIALLLMALGFFYQTATPFFLSVGGILFLLTSFWKPTLEKVQWRVEPANLVLPALWLLGLISLLWTQDQAKGIEIVMRQLVLLLIPVGVMLHQPKPKELLFFVRTFLLLLLLFSLVTALRYLLHLDEVKTAVSESGAVPIWDGYSAPWHLTPKDSSKFVESGINHIYFSILQVLGCWLLIMYRKSIRFSILYLVVFVVTLHWFFARTGLLAFYLSLGFFLITQITKIPLSKKQVVLAAFVGVILLFFGAKLPGIKARIVNMQQDLKALQTGGEEINHRSFAMRWEAWKNAWWMIGSAPVLGVGIGDGELEMNRSYEIRKTPLFDENRIPPHNQYLETALQLGFFGFFMLMAILGVALKQNKGGPYKQSIVVTIYAGMLMESLLQTQIGVSMFAVFISFLPYFRSHHDTI